MEMYYSKTEYNKMVKKYESAIRILKKKIAKLEQKTELPSVTEEPSSNE